MIKKARMIGVNFDTLRSALVQVYFNPKTQEEFDSYLKYVLPMQHNFDNPIKAGSKDTFIQYWINSDERLTQDFTFGGVNILKKLATCTVRFLGAEAELWAKSFHHFTKRKVCYRVFNEYCNGAILEYMQPITTQNVDYFAGGNSTKAFTLLFKIEYDEQLIFDSPDNYGLLGYINLAKGEITNG